MTSRTLSAVVDQRERGQRTEASLAALIARHRAGDPSALNAFMVELYPITYRFIYRLASPLDADAHADLVQAAMEQVCRALPSFAGQSMATTYVFAICRRVVARQRRYQWVRTLFKGDAEEVCKPHGAASPDDQVELAQETKRAFEALHRLDLDERTAFVLHEVEGIPLEDIARALGKSTRTVKRRLRDARHKLAGEQS